MLSIRKCGHKELERYYQLFEMDFDSREILPKLAVHKALTNGSMELLAVVDEESKMDLAFALVATKSLYGYVLLKYLSVMPWCREQGIGIESMRLINKRYADRQGIIAELTEYPEDEPQRRRKLQRFLARFGYVEAESDYRIGGGDALVMIKPIKGSAELSPVLHRVIADFYSRFLSPFAMNRLVDIRPVKKTAE